MARARVEELLGAPVLLHGIQLGRPVDVVLDKDLRRALGFEVRCGDESRRFLPLSVARRGERGIELASPLVLLESSELAFYTRRGATFSALRNVPVQVGGDRVGTLVDLVLDEDGAVVEVVVTTKTGRRRIAYGPMVVLGPARRSFRAAS